MYCAIVRAMKGRIGVLKQRCCLQRILLICAHTVQNKTISCKGQTPAPCSQALGRFSKEDDC